MVEELVEGNIYWSIRSSIESEGYGDCKPRIPWQGTFVDSVLCRFDEKGNIDTDNNACAFVHKKTVFSSEEEAKKAYMEEMNEYLNYLEEVVKQARQELEEYLNTGKVGISLI